MNGFVISWFFPPGNSSEGLVAYKLLRNSRLNYTVWTRGDSNYDVWDRPVIENNLTSKNISVVKSKTSNISEWITDCFEYFDKNVDKYDFIMSRAMPKEAHEAALLIKRKYPNIPWVASFGDPMVNTPYIKYVSRKENPVRIKGPRSLRKYIAWELDRQDKNIFSNIYKDVNDSTFKKADCLIFNNEYQIEHAFSSRKYYRYKEKALLLYHSYDSSLYPRSKSIKNKKITFTYIGHLDDIRNSMCLLEAIKELKSRNRDLDSKAIFNFYGHMCDRDKAFILDNKLTTVVKLNGDIDYIESLNKAVNSDFLISIDANFNDNANKYVFLPAKIVDYIGAKVPIIAITPINSITRKIMSRINCGICIEHNPKKIEKLLYDTIYDNRVIAAPNEDKITDFKSENVSRILDDAITSLVIRMKEK